ncbi:DUF4129 domain-containing protein [Chloroflexota bacterium]
MTVRSRLASLNWVTVISFPLSVTLMEVLWVFPWLVWLARLPKLNWPQPPLSLLSLAFILGISFLSTRFLLNRKWPIRWIRLSIIACGILTVFIIIRAEYGADYGLLSGDWFVHITRLLLDSFNRLQPLLIALILSILLWWRGIRLGRSRLQTSDIFRSFLLGLATLIVLIILSGVTTGADLLLSYNSIWVQLTGYFFFGLLAIALANLQTVRGKMSPEGMSSTLSHRWLSVLLLVAGGVVTIGIGIASIVSADFVAFLARTFGTVSDLITRGLSYLFMPLGYLVELFYRIGQFIVSLISGNRVEPIEMANLEIADLPEAGIAPNLAPELLLALKWFFFALIAALVIFLLIRSVFRYMTFRGSEDIDEVHESLWSLDLFKSDLRLMLSKLRWRFGAEKKAPAEVGLLPGWYAEDYPGTLNIRQIYECLLWEGSRANMTRQYHETPNEYASRLGSAIPDSQKPLDEITDLYIEARYGELETRGKQIAHANNLWKSLRRLFHRPEGEPPVPK